MSMIVEKTTSATVAKSPSRWADYDKFMGDLMNSKAKPDSIPVPQQTYKYIVPDNLGEKLISVIRRLLGQRRERRV